MTSRRQFLQAASAMIAPAAASDLFIRGAQAQSPPSFYAFIYDDRFLESQQIARQAQARGQRVSAISGDVTRLWYDDLYHRWKAGPAAIYGVTTAQSLFCLETLGNDAGLRRLRSLDNAPRRARTPLLEFWALVPISA